MTIEADLFLQIRCVFFTLHKIKYLCQNTPFLSLAFSCGEDQSGVKFSNWGSIQCQDQNTFLEPVLLTKDYFLLVY